MEGFNYLIGTLQSKERTFKGRVQLPSSSLGYSTFTGSSGAPFTNALPPQSTWRGGDGGARSGVLRVGAGQFNFYFDGPLNPDGELYVKGELSVPSGTAGLASTGFSGWSVKNLGVSTTGSNPFCPGTTPCSIITLATVSSSAPNTPADPGFACQLDVAFDFTLAPPFGPFSW